MNKEALTTRQAVCLLAMFLFGSTAIMGMGTTVDQDSWITLLIASAATIPMFLLFARLNRLYPEKDMFCLIESIFGKVAGKIIIGLLTWYSLHLCSLIMRNFSEFVEITVMPETPQLPIMLIMMAVVAYLARSGIETMGKWASIMLPVVSVVVLLTILFSLNRIEISRIMPIMGHSVAEIGEAAYHFLTFPFLESVVFACALSGLSQPAKPYKSYLLALLIGTLSLLGVVLRNTMVLGPQVVNAEYFPSYIAVKVINMGSLISRIEGSISMNLIIGGLAKSSVCLLAAAKGVNHLFGMKGIKRIILPLALFAVALGSTLFKSSMEMFDFIKDYGAYAIPFQIIIPLLIWIGAEIKSSRGARKGRASVLPDAG
jgi:spore germination protein KB